MELTEAFRMLAAVERQITDRKDEIKAHEARRDDYRAAIQAAMTERGLATARDAVTGLTATISQGARWRVTDLDELTNALKEAGRYDECLVFDKTLGIQVAHEIEAPGIAMEETTTLTIRRRKAD